MKPPRCKGQGVLYSSAALPSKNRLRSSKHLIVVAWKQAIASFFAPFIFIPPPSPAESQRVQPTHVLSPALAWNEE